MFRWSSNEPARLNPTSLAFRLLRGAGNRPLSRRRIDAAAMNARLPDLENESTESTGPALPSEESIIDALVDAKPDEFRLSVQGEIRFKEVSVARLSRGASLGEPELQLLLKESYRAVAEPVLQRAVKAKLNVLWNALRFERDDLASTDNALLRDISGQMKEGLGSLRVRQVQGLIRALQKSGRGALSESGVIVGRRHIYAPKTISKEAAVIRYALVTAFKGSDAPLSWKPSPVLLLDKSGGVAHLSGGELERLGYERLGARAVRLDVVERIVDPRFAQKQPVYLPTLMHTLRCSEAEATAVARQLRLAGASKGNSPRRR